MCASRSHPLTEYWPKKIDVQPIFSSSLSPTLLQPAHTHGGMAWGDLRDSDAYRRLRKPLFDFSGMFGARHSL
jgi:hypothetical protein